MFFLLYKKGNNFKLKSVYKSESYKCGNENILQICKFMIDKITLNFVCLSRDIYLTIKKQFHERFCNSEQQIFTQTQMEHKNQR